ncbi:MAG: SH3 domain-containing protein [candidate division Zixibacteria bacterium]|nr:SH3 domain-containing protein [candidate division Zixibacteria bacterium]
MKPLIRALTRSFVAGVILFLARPNAFAQNTPLSANEVQARQLAIRILRNLQPIEQWIESGRPVAAEPTSDARMIEITGTRVNFRSGPSTGSAVSGSGLKGERYEYIRTEGEWHLIKMDGQREAYVSVQYSRLVEAGEPPAAAKPQGEQLPSKYQDRARRILGENIRDLDELKRIARESQSDFRKRYGGMKIAADNAEPWAAAASLMKIQKYERGTSSQFDRIAKLAGGSITPVQQRPASATSRRISGSVAAGIGTNTAKSSSNGTEIAKADVTRSNVSADLSAELTPSDRLGFSAGRSEEVHFAPITRLNAGVDYQHKFGEKASVGAGAGLRKFGDERNDSLDQDEAEFSLQASVKPSKALHAGGRIGFSNTGGVVEYTQAAHDLQLEAGTEDNTRNRIGASVLLNRGGKTVLEISAHNEACDFDQSDDFRSYSRTGGKLSLRHRPETGRSSVTSLEVLRKSHDTRGERDYTDFRGEFKADALGDGGRKSSGHFLVNYRNLQGTGPEGFLDYIECRVDALKEPGQGVFWESNLYGQYFLADGDAKRDALVTQFGWMGLMVGGESHFKIGPHLATNTILVTTDTPDVGLFEHPGNTLRYGAKASADMNLRPLRIRGAGRYEWLKYYNVDGAPTPTRFELEGEGFYRVGRRIDIEARLKYYVTGSNDPGAIENSEIDILVGLVYRIGGSDD